MVSTAVEYASHLLGVHGARAGERVHPQLYRRGWLSPPYYTDTSSQSSN